MAWRWWWFAAGAAVVVAACGARTPLKERRGGGGGDRDAGERRDGGVVATGLCRLERGAAVISGGLDSFPSLARGADAVMLVFTRQGRSGEFIHAVRLTPD